MTALEAEGQVGTGVARPRSGTQGNAKGGADTPPPRKKLIEVALPLEAINKASAREKSIRHGHPSTLHLWWARRPLAACRAVLFASFVDDPDSDPAYRRADGSVDEDRAAAKRAQLFDLIEELVQWENSNNERVINRARYEIARCVASRKVETGEFKLSDVLEMDLPEPEWTGKPPRKVTARVGDFLSARLGPNAEDLPRVTPEQVNAFLLNHAPPVLDPFAGGGSIPLEAQRLGLRALASDLNPVPVLINKALIEIPSRFKGMPPVNPASRNRSAGVQSRKSARRATQGDLGTATWKGTAGLADDVRYYGRWMTEEAERRIGHLYPKIAVTAEMASGRDDLKELVGQQLTIIAWLWARTVPSPNPAADGAAVPLVKSFWLATKKHKRTWVRPVVAGRGGTYSFYVGVGAPPADFNPAKGTMVSRRGGVCVLTGTPMPFEYIRSQAAAGNLGTRLMAVVAEGKRGRVYLPPTSEQEQLASIAVPEDRPNTPIPEQALGFSVQNYGMDEHWKLFTARQLVAMGCFSQLISDVRAMVAEDARHGNRTGQSSDPSAGRDLSATAADDKGSIAESYADAVSTYLAAAVSRVADYACSLTTWASNPQMEILRNTFSRQTLSMSWDFAEGNVFGPSSGTLEIMVAAVSKAVERLGIGSAGCARQADAASWEGPNGLLVSTDPPYYDNIGYADLSDFFYIWLRRSLSRTYPDLFKTMLTPKVDELIATPYRHAGCRDDAMRFFETGLGRAFGRMRDVEHLEYPLSVFYAFRQSETEEDEDAGGGSRTASTGWESMLEGLLASGFGVSGTWPMRTEKKGRVRDVGSNALASSVVLVCYPRSAAAPATSRREFVLALKQELPHALQNLQAGNVAPVDLAQAAIGPGMAVFSRYSQVLEADGSRMRVRAALSLINQVLDESLSQQEGDFDAWSRWAVKWFEQRGTDDGPYGEAETLSTAMGVAVQGVVEAGIAKSGGGKVRLLRRKELAKDWNPAADARLTVWETTQHLVKALEEGGEDRAADLLRRVQAVDPSKAEAARELAYRLYGICERKKWAQEALGYNALVVAWPRIEELSRREKAGEQLELG